MSSPINLTWTGDAFEPVNRFWATKCDQRFVVGENYTLDEVHARSHATHAHYFAALHDIWQSLPETMGDRFPTEEHLRKYALIRTGYRTETQHVCKTPAEAERLAAAIRPYDTYQAVVLDDAVVTVYNAISQDMRSMDKQTFQRSKEAVLDFCSELVGIEPAETRRSAGLPPKSESGYTSPLSPADDATPQASQQEPIEGGSANDGSVNQQPTPVAAEPSLIPDADLPVLCRFAKDVLNMAGDRATSGDQMSKVMRRWINEDIAKLSDQGRAAAKSIQSSVKAIMADDTSVHSAISFHAEMLGCDESELEVRK